VEQVGPVHLDAADADGLGAVTVGHHGHPVGMHQIHLAGQQPGARPGGDDAPGVAAQQQRRHDGPQPVGQLGEVRAGPLEQRRGGDGVAVVASVHGQGQGADRVGQQPDAAPDGRQPQRRLDGDRLARGGRLALVGEQGL
jgi:hypothetical protein